MLTIDRKEVVRYLGVRGQDPETYMPEEIGSVEAEVLEAAEPRSVTRRVGVSRTAPGKVRIGDMDVRSADLYKNLKGCTAAWLMAATIGPAVDRLIRRYEIRSASRAMIAQAVSAAAVESYCDEINEALRERSREDGEYLRPRFSPGYGDFSLEHQRDMDRMLDLAKHTGIHLTEGLLMVPSKSVTAVIGISPDDTNCILQGCEACGREDCPYRRDTGGAPEKEGQ